MKVQSAKAKGRRLQQQIARDILTLYPDLHEDDVRSTSMGAQGEDILLSEAARKKFPYSVEAKNQERLNIWAAVEQGEKNAKGFVPLTIFKKNNTKPYVALPWEHFLKLVSPNIDNSTETNHIIIREAIRQLESLL